jgi:hypothetical protein
MTLLRNYHARSGGLCAPDGDVAVVVAVDVPVGVVHDVVVERAEVDAAFGGGVSVVAPPVDVVDPASV